MNHSTNPENWRQERLKNYAEKLQLSKRKALRRLHRFTSIEDLIKEFDTICDSPFRSNNEPGINYLERNRRLNKILDLAKEKHHRQRYIQLSLFNNYQILKLNHLWR